MCYWRISNPLSFLKDGQLEKKWLFQKKYFPVLA